MRAGSERLPDTRPRVRSGALRLRESDRGDLYVGLRGTDRGGGSGGRCPSAPQLEGVTRTAGQLHRRPSSPWYAAHPQPVAEAGLCGVPGPDQSAAANADVIDTTGRGMTDTVAIISVVTSGAVGSRWPCLFSDWPAIGPPVGDRATARGTILAGAGGKVGELRGVLMLGRRLWHGRCGDCTRPIRR